MLQNRGPSGNAPIEKAVAYLWRGLGFTHRGVGIALVWSGRQLARGLSYLPWSCRFGLMAAVMAVATLNMAVFGQDWYMAELELTGEQEDVLVNTGMTASFALLATLAKIIGFLLMATSFLAFVRHRLVWLLLKVAGAAYGVIWLLVLIYLVRVPSMLYRADTETFDEVVRNDYWLFGVWGWVPVGVLGALFLVCLMLCSVRAFYAGARRPADAAEAAKPLWGDRLVETIKTGGEDPRFRTSAYWSTFLHFFILFLYPLIQRGCFGEPPYAVPKGSGKQKVQIVKVKKIKKKKKQFVLNMNSPIIFWVPEDTEMHKKLDKDTMDQYEATSIKGQLGKGGGGSGGWPGGMENARVRFIRLEYSGGDWDQDMGKGSDYNMLLKFHELTGFKIADNTESVRINRLRRFPKNRAPPFVYVTGKQGMRLSRTEINTLRWYCFEEGGMIFADNGGGSFNRAFRSAMRRVFPDKRWINIADDDILYRQPFLFPNGAPRLWHHSGNRALGMKHQGRWIVFYHQGDINDAWKTGHSGASEEEAQQAYKLAVNVINYAFNQYMHIHYGD